MDTRKLRSGTSHGKGLPSTSKTSPEDASDADASDEGSRNDESSDDGAQPTLKEVLALPTFELLEIADSNGSVQEVVQNGDL
jgi:hypothetical protein